MSTGQDSEHVNAVIIGAGQAGLSVGYHLQRQGVRFVILEARERVGDVWRERWDSLRLFTPARFDGLDGMPFPASWHAFPTKDEMAQYLESYVARFALPVRTGWRVDRLSKHGSQYLIESAGRRIVADQVIVAMATYQSPRTPAFARALDPRIVQLHSLEYRRPAQLQDGAVLIVGAGNSGSEIGLEVARTHRTLMSGRDTGHLPFRIDRGAARLILPIMLRLLFHRVLTTSTSLGRKVRPKIVSQGGPLIRVKPSQLAAASIERVAKVAGVRDGRPLLEDGRVLDVANVIWCTGFHPGFSWIALPIFDAQREPRHDRGVVTESPGLYFVGLHFLHALSSTMIHGVGRDARYVAKRAAERAAAHGHAEGAFASNTVMASS